MATQTIATEMTAQTADNRNNPPVLLAAQPPQERKVGFLSRLADWLLRASFQLYLYRLEQCRVNDGPDPAVAFGGFEAMRVLTPGERAGLEAYLRASLSTKPAQVADASLVSELGAAGRAGLV